MSDTLFVRTCQSCSYKQVAKPPKTYKNEAWREIQCKRCHSIDLDYGSMGWERDQQGKLIRIGEKQ